ncbi:hypothetical protein M011DRAFT_475759 [Sporormia fimetaria CBS 119925]|uniref:Uncharacterized protein n=1 Tax=Sporormia fimetaria CBS 119925 TaxID=1340428 RepID=A0A6A6VEI3_9PLEO|nr:hypothetical protein M011DRAFT_475759 [Sporormia fimetaria CBS 119925]
MQQTGSGDSFWPAFWMLMFWCTAMKLVKLMPHYRKHPVDIFYFPAHLLFSWFGTVVKLYAMCTCGNTFWATSAAANKQLEAAGKIDPLVIVGVLADGNGTVTPPNETVEGEKED